MKVQKGDKVTISGEVVSHVIDVTTDGNEWVNVRIDGGWVSSCIYVKASSILTVTPHEIQVGDEVKAPHALENGKVLSIDGECAWIRFNSGVYLTLKIADLKRAG